MYPTLEPKLDCCMWPCPCNGCCCCCCCCSCWPCMGFTNPGFVIPGGGPGKGVEDVIGGCPVKNADCCCCCPGGLGRGGNGSPGLPDPLPPVLFADIDVEPFGLWCGGVGRLFVPLTCVLLLLLLGALPGAGGRELARCAWLPIGGGGGGGIKPGFAGAGGVACGITLFTG